MFINFMCEPDIGKANAEYIGYTTPMESVREILDEDLADSEIAFPPEEVEAKEKVFTALSDEVNNELDVKWSEMKSYNEGGSSRRWWHWPASISGARSAAAAATCTDSKTPIFTGCAAKSAACFRVLQRERKTNGTQRIFRDDDRAGW